MAEENPQLKQLQEQFAGYARVQAKIEADNYKLIEENIALKIYIKELEQTIRTKELELRKWGCLK